MIRVNRIAAGGASIAMALAIAWLSRAPTRYARGDDALLRLSWRLDGARAEECRRRTEEELQALAPHMRTAEVCTGRILSYELNVDLDGAALVRDTIDPGGARGDRPVYVYRDVPLSSGRHAVSVEFRAMVPETFGPSELPLEYRFESELDIFPTEVALITTDPSGSALVLRGP
jgi:hypothetical protein